MSMMTAWQAMERSSPMLSTFSCVLACSKTLQQGGTSHAAAHHTLQWHAELRHAVQTSALCNNRLPLPWLQLTLTLTTSLCALSSLQRLLRMLSCRGTRHVYVFVGEGGVYSMHQAMRVSDS